MDSSAALGAASVGLIIGTLIFAVIAYFIAVIPMYKMFKKADEKGWKAFVPIVNTYTMYKITWKTSIFWIVLIISFVTSILSGYSSSLMQTETSTAIILLIALIVLAIISFVISIIGYHKISTSFGHDVGYTIGLIFLNLIFMYIIAFGNSTYQKKTN